MLALLALAFLHPALAADVDGDGVSTPSDCDDADPNVYRTESSGSADYTLSTDAEVAAFCETYCSREMDVLTLQDVTTTEGLSCVTSVDDLVIDAPDLLNLSGLDSLERAGALVIPRSGLRSLEGLDALGSLGDLSVGCEVTDAASLSQLAEQSWDFTESLYEINEIDDAMLNCDTDGNPSMENLDGLSALTELENVFLGVGQLTDLHGLEGVSELENLGIYGQSELSTLRGLDAIEAINDEIFVGDCDGLSDLSGLGALEAASMVSLQGNDGLTDLRGLDALGSTYLLWLDDNSRMRSLRGLDSLADGFALHVEGRSLMTDLSGLDGVTTLTRLDLLDMPMLESLDGLESLSTVSEDLQILGAPRLSSLEALSSLTRVGDRLSLGCFRNFVGSVTCRPLFELASLHGLEALTRVSELSLVQLPKLTDLDGLDALATVGVVEIEGTGLSSLSGLGAVTTLSWLNVGCHTSYDDQISDLPLYRWACGGNRALTSLDGLSALTSLSSLRVVGNPALTDVDELSGTRIRELEVANNAALTSLAGLGTMDRLSTISLGCWSFAESDGFQSVSCPGQASLVTGPTVSATTLYVLHLHDLPALTDLSGLGAVTSTDTLYVSGALGASALDGLDHMSTVAGDLVIGCKPAYWYGSDGSPTLHCSGTTGLSSLDGLGALTWAGRLVISNNTDLSDVTDLHGLTRASSVTISYNRSLYTSDADALVSAIDRISGTSTVTGNRP